MTRLLWKLVLAVLGAGIEIIHAEELEKALIGILMKIICFYNYNLFIHSKESNSSLAFIPKSHNITYKRTLSNILRIIHHKIKKKQNFLFKKIIERIISKEVNYKVGDICVFYCNLYHSGLSKINTSTKRLAAVIRYGGEGKHAKNFINYELNYRQGKNKYLVCKNKTKFFEFLKKNNLFISPEIPRKY